MMWLALYIRMFSLSQGGGQAEVSMLERSLLQPAGHGKTGLRWEDGRWAAGDRFQRLVSEGMWRHRELRLQNDYMATDGCYFLSWQDGNPKRKRSERRQELV